MTQMIEMKTTELIGPALDWAVAQIESETEHVQFSALPSSQHYYAPSRKWAQGGPLIEPNRISLMLRHDGWWIACVYNINDEAEYMQLSDCPLEAAMRCLVASKLGDTVQVPKELLP